MKTNLAARICVLFAFALSVVFVTPQGAQAQTTAFRQAVAEGAARDEALAEFYRGREFNGIWTGSTGRDRARRNALLAAFANAADHGLPAAQYDPNALMARLQAANTPSEKGAMEVEMSSLFLSYARDIQTGILTPSNVVAEIHREIPLRSRLGLSLIHI